MSLGFNSQGHTALSSIPDELSNHGVVSSSIYSILEVQISRPSRAILLDRTKQPVFAVEVTVGSLRL